ncbi:prominin-1-A-like [Rhinatrema bivittatum]|uniref:prominin-1-A-like n=1 Tax=Rhinatrema bivittatum TaxID=194408 RepID=UPI00112C9D36|nr:prominin-1-A-like [Rhinatrema bivittatum]XP_029466045.1 prominin-1-A-like [Rhinatrema bivittatum]XP_029466046.1 prominin-1-A-like [Rhinatrema bivittatum]
MDLPNLTQPVYKPGPEQESGSTKVFNDMVHTFLGMVQPNPFPSEFLQTLIKNNFKDVNTREVLLYEVGFLVCVAIGILFIIFMPLVGAFFCCCRCCNNCGGKMLQKQTKQTNCKRQTLCGFLFLVTAVILAGDICAFVSNSQMTQAVQSMYVNFNNSMDNVQTFMNTISKDLDSVVGASKQPIMKTNNSLINIGPILGGMIAAKIGKEVNQTLTNITDLFNVLNSTAEYMTATKNTFQDLQDEQNVLSQNLSSVQQEIGATLNKCGSSCGGVSTDGLVFDANFTMIPDTKRQMQLLSDLLNSDFSSVIQKAYQALNDIPDMVKNKTKSNVSAIQNQLLNIQKEMENVKQQIPVGDMLQNVTSTLGHASTTFYAYKSNVTEGNYYRWIIGLCLCCIVLLIVLCNVLGMILGAAGLKSSVSPTRRSGVSDCGGDFFMAGAGFSFIFSWLLMLVVLILFLVGGNSYTLICKPWSDQQLYKFLDTPNLIPNFNLSEILGLQNATVNISSIYRDCHNNEPLWSTLHLDQKVPLDKILNISKYTSEINAILEKFNISLTEIKFLDANQTSVLKDLASSGIDALNFTDISEQMKKNTTKVDLLAYADQLDDLANKNASLKSELNAEAQQLREIQKSIDTSLQSTIKSLNNTIQSLQAVTSQIPSSVNSTIFLMEKTQNMMKTSASQIVKNESKAFLDILLGYFDSYIEWIKTMLTENIARCAPLAGLLDMAQVVVCDHIVNSLNAFWFSLGWCVIFFIPSIILAVKLAKYYRRMTVEDVYEESAIPMARLPTSGQHFIPRAGLKS